MKILSIYRKSKYISSPTSYCYLPVSFTADRETNTKKSTTEDIRYGSFYLRVGIVAFGIGSMVYCGLEFGQYFELKGVPECQNILIAITPATRMILTIVQIQFFFLNHKEIFMAKHQIISRFGLMHMIATNLCEWLYVIIEETKHEIIHFTEKHDLIGKFNKTLKDQEQLNYLYILSYRNCH